MQLWQCCMCIYQYFCNQIIKKGIIIIKLDYNILEQDQQPLRIIYQMQRTNYHEIGKQWSQQKNQHLLDVIFKKDKEIREIKATYQKESALIHQKYQFLQIQLQETKQRLQQAKKTEQQLMTLLATNCDKSVQELFADNINAKSLIQLKQENQKLRSSLVSQQKFITMLKIEMKNRKGIQSRLSAQFSILRENEYQLDNQYLKSFQEYINQLQENKQKQIRLLKEQFINIKSDYQRQINQYKSKYQQAIIDLKNKDNLVKVFQKKLENKLFEQEMFYQNKLMQYEQKIKSQQKDIMHMKEQLYFYQQNREESIKEMKNIHESYELALNSMNKYNKRNIKEESIYPSRANISSSLSEIIKESGVKISKY